MMVDDKEAMEAAIREGPDIIFVDVQMPGISLLERALALKRRLNMVYIVLMSEKECFARNSFDIGVEDYILKTLRQDRILKVMGRAV